MLRGVANVEVIGGDFLKNRILSKEKEYVHIPEELNLVQFTQLRNLSSARMRGYSEAPCILSFEVDSLDRKVVIKYPRNIGSPCLVSLWSRAEYP